LIQPFQSKHTLLAVPVEPGEDLGIGTPKELFTMDIPFSFLDVSPDGERFLVLLAPSQIDWRPIEVMLGWKEYLPPP